MGRRIDGFPWLEDSFLPIGVDETGELLPRLTSDDLLLAQPDSRLAAARAAGIAAGFGLAVPEVSPGNLKQAGWGVVFAPDLQQDVKNQLAKLIERRKEQAGGTFESGGAGRFRCFEGADSPRAGESVRDWLERHEVTFALVDPSDGVPLYLLLVASPDSISFEFQYLLDTYWCVGRLWFERVEDYGNYASRIMAYEDGASAAQAKRVAVFAPQNPGDRSTGFLTTQLAKPLVEGKNGVRLGTAEGFACSDHIGVVATKPLLRDLFRDPPALLFSGSHGLYSKMSSPEQEGKIGAVVTSEWGGTGTPVMPEHCFRAVDLAQDTDLRGMIWFLFACYGGGCPEYDTYKRQDDGKRKKIADRTFLSHLPCGALTRGALAVFAHVDRAFATSFQTSRMGPQIQEIRSVLNLLMKGERIGQATDAFNLRWSVLSSELSDLLRDRQLSVEDVSDFKLAGAWLARDDARNYIILGDPAVRLRVDNMAAPA